MIQEFKDFINKGNVVTAAVAFVMGLTFKPIVDTIVNRIVMPLIGLVVGNPNFDTIGLFACEEAGSEAAAAEGLINGCAGSAGAVLTVVLQFIFVALALFFIIKAYNKMQEKNKEPEPDPEPEADSDEVVLLREIRELLAAQAAPKPAARKKSTAKKATK